MPEKKSAKKSSNTSHAADKKSTSKSAAPAGGTGKTSKSMAADNAEKKAIQKQITDIMSDLPLSELSDLLRDAKILKHNAGVKADYDRNKELRASMPKPDASSINVREVDSGDQFFITLNGHSSVFTLGEMRKLVSMAHGSGERAEVSGRIYTWLERERLDVVRNSSITGKTHPSIEALVNYLVNNYTVKK